MLIIDGKTDVRVEHAQRAGDLGTQIIHVLPSIEPTHELGADPLLRQVVIGAGSACGLVERHGCDGANGRLPVTPMRRCECRRRFRKAPTMGEHMPQRDGLLAMLAEPRPVPSYGVVEGCPPAFDLLQKGNRGEWLGPGEKWEERI